MCGFVCAFARQPGGLPDGATLGAMDDAVRHRGPDAQGRCALGSFAAAHRRLTIIDLSGGQQPMAAENGKVWLVFNGEIYNFRELASELRAAGRPVTGASDTECLLAAYLAWGEACVDRLNGMFAFVIYDERTTPRIFAARDRFGEKPLYVYETSTTVFFASELKGLLPGRIVPARFDPVSLYSYFTLGYVAGPRTIFAGVRRLPPGHCIAYEAGSGAIEWPYWTAPSQRDELDSEADVIRAIQELLHDSVRMRMIADVPLGFFLSGGVDSSAVVAIASELSSARPRTFSIGFEQADFDERPYARFVAERFGTEHRELVLRPENLELIEEIAWFADEPISDDSLIPAWCLSKMVREEVKVALSGDGGDELFAGYAVYRGHVLSEWARWLPHWIRASAAEGLRRWPWGDPPARFRRLALARNLEDASLAARQRFVTKQQVVFRRDALSAMSACLAPVCDVRNDYAIFGPCFEERQPLGGIAKWQQTINLVDLMLFKIDRMSMAHGLEVRAPFLDHRLAELMSRVPFRIKLRHGRTKYILRKALEDRLPRDFLWRPKQGFNVPLNSWFAGDLDAFIRAKVLAPGSLVSAIFPTPVLETILGEHQRLERDWSRALWALLMFETWSQRYGLDRSALPLAP